MKPKTDFDGFLMNVWFEERLFDEKMVCESLFCCKECLTMTWDLLQNLLGVQ